MYKNFQLFNPPIFNVQFILKNCEILSDNKQLILNKKFFVDICEQNQIENVLSSQGLNK